MSVLIALMGCTSTVPCIPKVEIQEKLVEVPCFVHSREIPEPYVQEFPPFNEDNPKDWALEVSRIERENKINALAYQKALRMQIASLNTREPKCSP